MVAVTVGRTTRGDLARYELEGLLRLIQPCRVEIEWCLFPKECTKLVLVQPDLMQLPAASAMPQRPKKVLKLSVQNQQAFAAATKSGAGVLGEISELVDEFPELGELQSQMTGTLLSSKAQSTIKKYLPYVVKWKEFAVRFKRDWLPAYPGLFALFLQQQITHCQTEGLKSGTVIALVYAVDFIHKVIGVPGVAARSEVKTLMDGANRLLAAPVSKKKAMRKGVVVRLVQHWTAGGLKFEHAV